MAQGYVRLSTADIQPGLTVRAGPLNIELNGIQAAFNASSGHNHDGSTGGGAPLTRLSLAGFGANTGIVAATSSASFAARTITGTTNQVTLTNGDGVSGNPTVSLPSALTVPGSLTTTTTLVVGTTATVGGTLGVTGDFAVATNKFTVAAATGNTVVAGTLNVTGAITGALTGNADTATRLATSRNFSIAGSTGLTAATQGFDGTAAVILSLAGTLAAASGGTGVSNSNTITLGGNVVTAAAFSTSGANALILTTTGSTNVTLPTTGTLSTLAGAESLSNKTIVAAVLSGTVTGTYTLAGTPTITSPAITGGTINNAVIGGVTPAAGSFTTLTASGASTFSGLTTVSSSILQFTGNASYNSWTTTGRSIAVGGNTYTDSTGSGTIATRVGNSFSPPTLASTGSVTVTDAATVYIGGGPVAGTNTTITNTWALLVNGNGIKVGGNSTFTNTLTTAGLVVGTGTVTLGGSFTTSGAFDTTLTVSGTTNVTLPTTGTLATRAGTETFTNKTLTAPIISTISNTGTITLPTATTTLVGRDTTDTLTNKSMSGSANTFTNLPNSAFTNSSITLGTTTVALGATSATLDGLQSLSFTTGGSAPANGIYLPGANIVRILANSTTMLSFGSGNMIFLGGVGNVVGTGVFGFSNCSVAPGSNPTAGGLMYAESGALKWRGSSGTVTTIAPA